MAALKILSIEDKSMVVEDIQGSRQGMGYAVTSMAAPGYDAIKIFEKIVVKEA